MRCQKLIDLLVDYFDGDLDAEQAERLEEHLSHCPPCEKFIESYRRTGKICKKVLEAEMPEALESSLFEFLRTELQSPKS